MKGGLLCKSDNNYGTNIPVAHAWVEFRMNDNTWLPVDPSTELVGDTEEGMATFQAAHYQAQVDRSLKLGLPEGFSAGTTRGLEFLPGEAQHSGPLEILTPTHPHGGIANIGIRAYTFPAVVPMGVRFNITDVAA